MPANRSDDHDEMSSTLLLGLVFGVAGAAVVLWLGGVLACLLSGRGVPHVGLVAGLRALAHPGDPSLAWRTAMPGPVLYWVFTALVACLAGGIGVLAVLLWRGAGRAPKSDVRATPGLADRRAVRAGGSAKTLLDRAARIRPSLARPQPHEVGYRLGTSRGVPVWMSVEDSLVILGPPRSGKGLHLVIPMLLTAPGAVITTQHPTRQHRRHPEHRPPARTRRGVRPPRARPTTRRDNPVVTDPRLPGPADRK